jgi:hypothetical protein
MWPNDESKRKPPDDPDDPWGWLAIILATCLAAVLVMLTEEPPFKSTTPSQQTETSDTPSPSADSSPGPK